ncbi:MAG TPA: wax ester/triacylglycerol synthase family O-acyltransferase [Bryobacteraceae bacterium]|nr:wax ester/triacylglycerol synthase family O-acyltransferase [Bryobacteraceae bacterium]
MPHHSDRLPPGDAAFLYLETNEAPLHIGSVSVLDGEIPFADYVHFIESKLPLIPRYRQRLVVPPFNVGHPTWEDDPDFDIRNHIFHARLKRGTQAELRALAARIFSRRMDRDKPLWDLTLVDGLGHGHSAFISRVHHCLVDGVSGVGIINVMLSPTPKSEPLPKKKPFHAAPLPDPALSFLDALASSFSEMADRILSAQEAALNVVQTLANGQTRDAWNQMTRLMPEILTPIDRLPFNQPILGPRKVVWTGISIPEVSVIRKALGGTLNDVVLTAVTSAVARYAELHGQPLKNRVLRLMVPVNLRQDGPGFGNRVSILPVNLPLDIADPAKLLDAVCHRTVALKGAHVSDLMLLAAAWIGLTPVPLFAALGPYANIMPVPVFNMVCTNVPGPQYPLYLLGREMLTFHPYVPIGNEMGVNCAIQSYNGKLFFGFTADTAAAPDAGHLADFLDDAFAALSQVATRDRATPTFEEGSRVLDVLVPVTEPRA